MKLQPQRLYRSLLLFLSFTLLFNLTLTAQNAISNATDSILTVKNFPLLAGIQQNSELHSLVLKNKVFRKIARRQAESLQQATNKSLDVDGYAEAVKFTDAEIKEIGKELTILYQAKPSVQSLVSSLRKKGVYATYESGVDTTYLRRAWHNAAQGINKILAVYIQGIAPRYAKIDSISFSKNNVGFKKQVHDFSLQYITKKQNLTFFELPLNLAIHALKINGRDEAARYVPLNRGLNQAPFQKIKTTSFDKYTYSLLLIPGFGPETAGVALDPKAMLRCDDAALRYNKGLAPFIVVSGGNVHPFQTPYNEAVEMKKYMVEKLGLPAEVILIEPDARHTTTNLRNTARIVYHFGMPVNKPILIVTDKSQSSYLLKGLAKASIRDLGYYPYQNIKKISETETQYFPNWQSLQVDPLDPLDP